MRINDSKNIRELREEIIRLGPWHQDIEIAPGVRTGEPAPEIAYPIELGTPTMYDPWPHMEWLVSRVYPHGLAGRSVMDCGCNAGGNIFSLTKCGAGKCFGFDARDHWIKQAKFLAQHLPSEHTEFATLDLGSLPDRHAGQFDITLFMGLFYHLPDPINGLRIAADHTKELLVVNTAIMPGGGGDSLVLNRESVTEVMSGVDGLAWLPSNEGVIRAILEWCGFPHVRLLWEADGGVRNWRRLEVIAARELATFAHFDAIAETVNTKRSRGWARRLLRRS